MEESSLWLLFHLLMAIVGIFVTLLLVRILTRGLRGKSITEFTLTGTNVEQVKSRIIEFFNDNNFKWREDDKRIVAWKGSRLISAITAFETSLEKTNSDCLFHGEFYLKFIWPIGNIKIVEKPKRLLYFPRRRAWIQRNEFLSYIKK